LVFSRAVGLAATGDAVRVTVAAPLASVPAARVAVAAVVATCEALVGAEEAPAAAVAARVAAAVGAADAAVDGAAEGAVAGAVVGVAAPPPHAARSASIATRLAVVRKILRLKRIRPLPIHPTNQ